MAVLHPSKPTRPTRRSTDALPCVAEQPGLGSNQVFADAAQSVFQTMLSTELRVSDYQPGTQISGKGMAVLIALNGPVAGTLIVCISQDSARKFVGTLTGMDLADISEAVMVDGICELVNMIAGAAKAHLDATDMRFDMTLPVSCVCEDICMSVKVGMPGGVLRCAWANETFSLGVWRVKEG